MFIVAPFALGFMFSTCCILLGVICGFSEESAGCFTLSSWCRVAVSGLCLFLAVSCVGMHCVIVAFPCHIHLLFVLFTYKIHTCQMPNKFTKQSVQTILCYLPKKDFPTCQITPEL